MRALLPAFAVWAGLVLWTFKEWREIVSRDGLALVEAEQFLSLSVQLVWIIGKCVAMRSNA